MPQPISDAARILGERIRDRRVKLSCSQEEIANLAGMNVSNYGKIERGLGNPNFHTIVLIASVLTVDPGALLHDIPGSALPARRETFTAADFVHERLERSRS
jgi:transcriptional regulator with XRE-family HTH domain